MKLVEILARELEYWADTTTSYTQDGCRTVWPWAGSAKPEFTNSWQVMPCATIDQNEEAKTISPHELAVDHETAIITREMWEAERAKLKEGKTVKANKDGWIRHRGGKCPVEAGTMVDVRYRDGNIEVMVADEKDEDNEIWKHRNDSGDIMAWRLHKPEHESEKIPDKCQGGECEMPDSDDHSDNCLLDAAIDQGWAGPLQWRDRIHEIDAASKDEEARHCAAMEAFDRERADLVAKLAAEGLAVIERVEVAPAEDMSDWRNWRVGDLVVLLASYGPNAKEGQIMVVSKFDTESPIQIQPVRITPIDDASAGWWPSPEKMRWHSRP